VTGLKKPPEEGVGAHPGYALLYFRGVISEAVTARVALPRDYQIGCLRQIDAFLDLVMPRMMEAFTRQEVDWAGKS